MKNWYDKLFLIIALLVAALGGWLGLSSRTADPLQLPQPVGASFSEELPQVAAPAATVWPEPQIDSDGWLFEVFTPPRVYFDPNTRRFIIELPIATPVDDRPPTPFGAELVEIRRDPLRFQMTGYTGDIGFFRVDDVFELLRGRPGREFPEAEIKIINVEEVRRVTEPEEGMTAVITRHGTARVRDLRTNREYDLESGQVALSATPVAELQVVLAGTNERVNRTLTAGESWSVNEVTYTLDRINEEDNSVIVTKVAEGEEPETETLLPVGRFIPPPRMEFEEVPLGEEDLFDLMEFPEDFDDIEPMDF